MLDNLIQELTKLKEESDAVLQRINNIKATQKQLKSLEQDLVRINTSRMQVRKYVKKLEDEITEIENKPAMRFGETLQQDMVPGWRPHVSSDPPPPPSPPAVARAKLDLCPSAPAHPT